MMEVRQIFIVNAFKNTIETFKSHIVFTQFVGCNLIGCPYISRQIIKKLAKSAKGEM